MSQPEKLGRYRIAGEIGRGAMGVVYRAMDPALDRAVAIKVISARQAAGSLPVEELEARFLREAKVAARISHPGVVTVFDAGREGDSLYLVMELIEGESLAQRMSEGRHPAGAEAYEMCALVAEALGAAHAMGVVHRDVKPANIMLCRDGRVKVADFGVAKAMGDTTNLTRTGSVVGSPAYMAPEQVRGEPIDGRADLFSLGVVLYELLMRRRPFPADTFTTLLYQILHEDPFADETVFRSLGEAPAGFLRSCLDKEPSRRVVNGATFAAAARALAAPSGGPTPAAPPPSPPTSTTAATAMMSSTGAGARVPPPMTVTAPTTVLPPVVTATGAPPPPPPPPAVREARGTRALPLLVLAAVAAIALVVVALVVTRRPAPPAGDVLGAATPAAEPTSGLLAAPTATPRLLRMITPVATPVPSAAPVPEELPAAVPGPAKAEPAPTETPIPEPTATPTPPISAVFTCSEGAEFNVSPEEAQVEVDGTIIGSADDWDGVGGGKTYTFDRPGVHYVRLSLDGYATTWVKITVDGAASQEIADVDTELASAPKAKKEKKDKKAEDEEAEDEKKEKKDKKDKKDKKKAAEDEDEEADEEKKDTKSKKKKTPEPDEG
jgi:serine/threonine-protein kinase